jgi:hypothetical protein
MWNNLRGPFTKTDLNSLSEPMRFVAQLHTTISTSILRAQAEGIGRGVQDIEHEIDLLQKPEEVATSGGWARLAASALGTAIPAAAAQQATVHLLRAHAESLRAAQSLVHAAVAHFEATIEPPPGTPVPVAHPTPRPRRH